MSSTIFVIVYVDDLLIIGSLTPYITKLITNLCTDFPITDLSNLHYFLGFEITPTSNGLLLTQ